MMDKLLVLSVDQSAVGATQNAVEFRIDDPDQGFTPRRAWLRCHVKEVTGVGTATVTFQDSPDGTTYTDRVARTVDVTATEVVAGSDIVVAIPTKHAKFIRGFIAVTGGITGLVDVDIIAG